MTSDEGQMAIGQAQGTLLAVCPLWSGETKAMGKKMILFSSEERADVEFVVDFLRQLADKLTAGEVIFRQGDQELAVTVPRQVVLEIKVEDEAKKGKTQRGLEIELEWILGEEADSPLQLG